MISISSNRLEKFLTPNFLSQPPNDNGNGVDGNGGVHAVTCYGSKLFHKLRQIAGITPQSFLVNLPFLCLSYIGLTIFVHVSDVIGTRWRTGNDKRYLGREEWVQLLFHFG